MTHAGGRVRAVGSMGGLLLVLLAWLWPGRAAQAAPALSQGDPPPAALGRIDAPTKAQLRRIWAIGRQVGRNPAVFARVGDSITSTGQFLTDCGYGREELGPHRELAALIRVYKAQVVDHVAGLAHNSFNHVSLAAHPAWTGADLLGLRWPYLDPPAPILQEYSVVNPSIALIMFGTNDIDQGTPAEFAAHFDAAILLSLQNGVIPIVSTLPDRQDTPANLALTPMFNAIIRDTAGRYNVPLIDLALALEELPNHGLEADGIHPTYYAGHTSNTFTAAGLRYGYNVRNLLTLQMLAKVRASVLADAPPDP